MQIERVGGDASNVMFGPFHNMAA